MKTLIKITTIALFSIIVACQPMTAQKNPKMSSELSLEQINKIYQEHRVTHTQNTIPPQNIMDKFVADFPEAKDIDWEKSAVLYEVEFETGTFGHIDHKAYYDLQGNLIIYKTEIGENQLPGVVKNAALAKYPKFKIDDADKIIKGKDIFYNIELQKGDMDIKLSLKKDGTILNEYID